MNNILILRDFFIRLYRRFDFILTPLLKFALCFVILMGLQLKVGYFERLSGALVIAIFSLLSAFFPFGAISFIAGIFLILDMFEVSYIMAAVGTGVLALILLLYYGFKPGTGIVIALVPFTLFLRIPMIVPVVLGLTMGVYAVVPLAAGVITFNLIKYFSLHAGELSAVDTDELVETFLSVIRGVLLDKYMILLIAAFTAAVVISAVVSRLSLNYARLTAVSLAAFAGTLIIAAADIGYGGSLGLDLLGGVLSVILLISYVLIFYAADYRGTERLEFEDDDYFYYVKAIPKIKPEDPEDYL